MSVSLAAIAAIASALTTVGSKIVEAKQVNEGLADLRASQDQDLAEYDRLLNRDYMDNPENQSLLRRLQELQRKNYDRARAINTVAGGTDASLAALQAQGNDIVTQTAQGMAAKAGAYKDAVRREKQATKRAYAQQMFALKQNKAQAIAQAGSQASQAFAGLAAAGGSAENPFATEAAEASASSASTEPVGAAAVTPAQSFSNPAMQEAWDNTDLNKALMTIPSIMNGYNAKMTPEEYDEWMAVKRRNADLFGVLTR